LIVYVNVATGPTKRYGAATAVDGVSFTINRGEIFGLLGPNGAGKTTTILMMLGLTEVTGGTVRVMGYDPVREPLQVKRLVGYLPDTVGFYDHMTAADNLRYTAGRSAYRSPSATPGSPPRLIELGLPTCATSGSVRSPAACASGSGLPRS
jgi:ABC-type multidrug transport system ATPase subunit